MRKSYHISGNPIRSSLTPVPSLTMKRMAYFLFKTEPGVYSFDDFPSGQGDQLGWRHQPDRRQEPPRDEARNESGSSTTLATSARQSEPAPVVSVDASDPKVPVVRVKVGQRLKHPKTLDEIKADPVFADSLLVKIGRLSVVPLTEKQWDWFLK